jgi:uncharacterized protein with von Willebrand factor type A (vWA) domain
MPYYLTKPRLFSDRFRDSYHHGDKDIPAKLNLYPEQSAIEMESSERALAKHLNAVTSHITPLNHAQADLINDMFWALYNGEATLQDKDGLTPSRQINTKLLEGIFKNPGFADTVAQTAGKIVPSLAASYQLFSKMMEDKDIQKIMGNQDDANDQEEKAANEQSIADAIQKAENNRKNKQDGDSLSDDVKDNIAEHEQSIQARMNKAESEAKEAIEALDKMNDNPFSQGATSVALKEAEEMGERANVFLKSWGDEKGEATFGDNTEVLQIIQDNNFDEVSKLVGRMLEASTDAMEAVARSYTGQIAEANPTRDIVKLFPTSRAYLSNKANPVLRGIAVNNLIANGGLLGWTLKSEGKEHGGALWYVDRSGSMSGQELTAAKAIALGSTKAVKDTRLEFAAEERYYEITPFQSDVDVHLRITSESTPMQHLEFAKMQDSGGTDFDPVFSDMTKRIKMMRDRGLKGLDLVIVTDGQAGHIDDTIVKNLLDAKEEMHCRLIYIQIGGGVNDQVKTLADTLIEVSTSDFAKDAEKLAWKITTGISQHLAEGFGSKDSDGD